MHHRIIVITGAAGFLGSAVTVDLARHHSVVALDRREPSTALVAAAPAVLWQQVDIADERALAASFRQTRERFGHVDVVIHFAAFCHFGLDWRAEYEATNVRGTSNVLRLATEAGVHRLVFASSMLAMRPPAPGEVLTRWSPTECRIPYGRSKCIGEEMVRDASDRLNSVVLRIGGAFSDWCELPPLHSLIKLWGGRSPLRRLVVGRGDTGIPYIHRDDLVRLVRSCVDSHERLEAHEVFLASQNGTVRHKDLLPIIHEAHGGKPGAGPILISPALVRVGLYLRLASGLVARRMPYERPWMLAYVDRPWVVDTTYTREKLRWDCSDGMGIRDRLPEIVKRRIRDRRAWELRNRRRNEALYAYD